MKKGLLLHLIVHCVQNSGLFNQSRHQISVVLHTLVLLLLYRTRYTTSVRLVSTSTQPLTSLGATKLLLLLLRRSDVLLTTAVVVAIYGVLYQVPGAIYAGKSVQAVPNVYVILQTTYFKYSSTSVCVYLF